MTLNAYRSGSTTEYDYGVPTNPRFVTTVTTGNRFFIVVYPDDNSPDTITEFGGSFLEYENLEKTAGYKIKCYDSLSEEGIVFNPSDFDTKDYFVLVHSDQAKMHHFAKITEVLSMDDTGDAFEFEPKLGNEIPEGTKFMIFSIPKTTKAIALSAGLTEEAAENYLVCSRPLFYFYNDKLDKDNELDHNIKYYARSKESTSSTTDLSSSSVDTTILTVQEYAGTIVDHSKYSMKLEMFDKLRDLDNPSNSPYVSNEGLSITYSNTNYDRAFPNARRDTDDDIDPITSYAQSGEMRYAHYGFSPDANNLLYNVIDANVQQSIGERSGFAEVKLTDSFRIMSKKIANFDKLRVRHAVYRGNLKDWFNLGATVKTDHGSNDFTFDTNIDLKKYLKAGDEIKIDDDLLFVETIATFDSAAFTQRINCRLDNRKETETKYNTTAISPSVGDILYRRVFKATPTQSTGNNTLLTDFNLIEGRFSNIYVEFVTGAFSSLYASVTSVDPVSKIMTLSFEADSYDSNPLRYTDGQYSIHVERIDGEIEKITQDKGESGQTFFNIEGRDKFNKLITPIVNKNFLFSEDIIYSSISPYNKLTALTPTLTCNFDDDATIFSEVRPVATFSATISLTAGDHIFVKNTNGTFVYVGEVELTGSGTQIPLIEYPKTEVSGAAAYKSSNKNYIFNKALSSNPLINSTTSLSGSSDKGVIFQSGREITRSALGSLLSGTSKTNDGDDLGYPISNAKQIESDRAFQGVLDTETFDIVNTLIDFNVLSVQESGVNKLVKVAPHIPLTLARVEFNYANIQDTTFTQRGQVAATVTDENYIRSTSNALLSQTNDERRFHGKPLYQGENKTFAGIITAIRYDGIDSYIYLDRKVSSTLGDKLWTLTYDSTYEESSKLTTELHLLNGSHLHSGKFISKLDSQTDQSNMPQVFDYPLYYTTMGSNPLTHSARFGPSLYRLFNIEKGNINKIKSLYSGEAISSPENYRFYSDKNSKIAYYASGYKMNYGYFLDSGTLQNNVIGTNINAITNHLLPETRGFNPPSGSNFFDADVFAANEDKIPGAFFDQNGYDSSSHYYAKDFLYHIDAKIARMFLFSVSDLLPYSSARYDSLMQGDKTITNYSLLSLKEPTLSGRSDSKDTILGSTETIGLQDSDYVASSIISANKTISDLKRFGLMRLTEVVCDVHFNQFDPENLVPKDKEVPAFDYVTYSLTEFTSGVTVSSSTSTTIVYSGAISGPSAGNNIFDKHGRFIGRVSTTPITTTTVTDDTLNLEEVYATNGTTLSAVPHYYGVKTIDKIRGRGKEDTSLLKSNIHLLKAFVVNNVGTNGYGESGSTWESHYGTTLENLASPARKPNIFLPLNIKDKRADFAETSKDAFSSYVLEYYSDLTRTSVTAATIPLANDYAGQLFNSHEFVALDRFKLEEAEELIDKGMVFTDIETSSLSVDAVGTGEQYRLGLVAIKSTTSPFYKESPYSANLSASDRATKADGFFMGIKLRLDLTGTVGTFTKITNKSTGNRNIFHYKILAKGYHKFLDFINLTGTYLYKDETDIAYVLSHEIDHTANLSGGGKYHIITTDKDMVGDICKIMQPNHTCFYDYSPKEIELNVAKSSYTKIANEEKMYDAINHPYYVNAKGLDSDPANNEGVLSTYVMIDIDAQNNGGYVVIRDPAKFSSILNEESLEVCVSDGDTTYVSGITYLGGDNNVLTFTEVKETKGVVSVSETIDLTVNGDITNSHTRTMIGAGVQIGKEANDIVNELLEEEGFVYSKDTSTNYYLAPNYQGVNLFTAIKFALDRVNKTLFVDGDNYESKDNQNDEVYASNIVIGDKSNVKIYGFEKSESIFNFYNDIIVYGSAHKSNRKDLRSIQKVGRKTLEHSDKTLISQVEVDNKARELFSTYNRNNQKIELLVNHENISTLQVGDIVNVEIAQENIPFSTFLVLQMEHQLTGLIRLELGRYSKLLEDTLSEISLLAKKVETENRPQNVSSNDNQFYFQEEPLKIKIRKILVRKRVSSGGFTLGFSTTLNTGTTPLGFGQGAAVTLTDLWEEEY